MPSNPIAVPFSSNQPPFQSAVVSVSPTSDSLERLRRKPSSANVRRPKVLHPIDNEDLRILLLENISPDAVKTFQANGWKVDHHTKAMSENDLVQQIGNYHAIGIRSKTKITERVIKAASKVWEIRLDTSVSSRVDVSPLAPRYRVLLHRRKSSRPSHRREIWYPRFQLSLLQLAFRSRTRHIRDHCACATIL
jgi:D-3-phosphoglycerate dehydrogenase